MLGITKTRRFLAHPFSKKARRKAKAKRQLRKVAKTKRRRARAVQSAAHEAELQLAYWATLAQGVGGVIEASGVGGVIEAFLAEDAESGDE